MKQIVIVATALIGTCLALILAHLALIEVGREVVVVYLPTPRGTVHKTRLWIVDDGPSSWIHPGNANARWWIQHMDANPTVEIDRRGQTRQYRALADPAAHAKVHQLLREKYGAADWWVRFLSGTDTHSGLLTHGEKCKAVSIRLEPAL